MQRKFLFWLSMLALIVTFAIPQVVKGQMGPWPGRMGGPGMGNLGMGNDVQIIHQLFANHAQIHRTVKQLPNGIQAVTESDNPQVAALIQAHVASMYRRMANQQPIPMIHMVPTLPTLLQNSDRYQRHLKNTVKGLTVTETASNPELVAIIRQHAQEVTQFAERGMSTVMNGSMR